MVKDFSPVSVSQTNMIENYNTGRSLRSELPYQTNNKGKKTLYTKMFYSLRT